MDIRILDPAHFTGAVADWLVGYIQSVLQKKPRFTLALSGGNTPKALYRLLAAEPYRDRIEWHRLHIFWGDERVVPFDSEESNAGEVFRTLLSHVPAVREQVYPIQTGLPPDEAASRYDALLHTYFDSHPTTFDLVLLGLGDDGHTLSLFPGKSVVHERDAWVNAAFLESRQQFRITLTAPVVNRAACAAFLVTGQDKAIVVREVLQGPYQPDTFPAQRIKLRQGNLLWFLDKAAARLVE